MARGVDELVDFLLSEIALCGVQGMHDSRYHLAVREYPQVSFLCTVSLTMLIFRLSSKHARPILTSSARRCRPFPAF